MLLTSFEIVFCTFSRISNAANFGRTSEQIFRRAKRVEESWENGGSTAGEALISGEFRV